MLGKVFLLSCRLVLPNNRIFSYYVKEVNTLCSLKLNVLGEKKKLLGKVIKLVPKGRINPKLKNNLVDCEDPVSLWYFTHT